MVRKNSRFIPIWKQIIAGCCVFYFISVWCVPVFMLPFVNVLPYVHESNFSQRLPISIAGSILFFFILFSLNPKNFANNLNSFKAGRWVRIKHLAGVLLGLAMFTCTGAWLSPNLFGAITLALPSTTYEETTEVVEAHFKGSKYKSVSLVLRNRSDGRVIYLTLSKRLFEYPHFNVGDNLRLYGEKTITGEYVNNFELIGNRLTNVSSRPLQRLGTHQ